MRQKLAWIIVAAGMLAACATGVDATDLGPGGDAGASVQGQGAQDAAHPTPDAAGAQDSGSSAPDTGSAGDDASPGDDASSSADSGAAQDSSSIEDSASVQDTGTPVPETGTGQDTGTTGGTCPSGTKYGVEAAAEIASGNITFCFSGVCGAGQCCFTGLSPGNICVGL